MNKTAEQRGDAYAAVRLVYDKSPGRSWRRLNSALQDVLTAAITGHLSFLPDDFTAIVRDMKGGYWMGSGDGSAVGERYHNLAVKVGHTSACIAFEQYAGRPAVLWSEDVKTPERLRVGSEFTWGGVKVTVTSIKTDHLVACTYHGHQYRSGDRLAIGDFECLNDRKYRQVEAIERAGETVTIRFGAPIEDPYSSKVKTVTKIAYADIAEARKKFDTNRRKALAAIAAADTENALIEVKTGLASNPGGTYRHFDIEDIRNAATERLKSIVEAAERALDKQTQEARRLALAASYASDLERWLKGEPARQWFHDVRLRVYHGHVEVSTGQSVTAASARCVLPIILRRRESRGAVANLMIDSYAVRELSDAGVQIGCTLIPWDEVERLPALLEASKC